MLRARLCCPLFVALLLVSGDAAFADIGPEPEVPSSCTEAGREQPGVDCDECEASQCEADFEDTEYEPVCTRDEGDSLVEVWCDGEPREVFSAAGGCGVTSPSGAVPVGVALLGAALVLLTWLVRRRRES